MKMRKNKIEMTKFLEPAWQVSEILMQNMDMTKSTFSPGVLKLGGMKDS